MSNSSKSTSATTSTSPQPSSFSALRTQLQQHNASFDQLLRFIPPQFYLPKQENSDDEDDEPAKPLTRKQKKELRKEMRSDTVKAAKREQSRLRILAMYDPDAPKTIPEIQAAMLQQQQQQKQQQLDSEEDDDEEDDSGSEEISFQNSIDSDENADEPDSPNSSSFLDSDLENPDSGTELPLLPGRPKDAPVPTPRELKEKLQRRIEEIRKAKAGGGGVTPAAEEDGESDDEDDEEDEQEEAKSKEDLLDSLRRKRGEVRDKRRKRRKEERREAKKNGVKREKKEGSDGRKGGGKANAPRFANGDDGEKGVDERPKKKTKTSESSLAVVPSSTSLAVAHRTPTSAAEVDFSNLSFATPSLPSTSTAKPRSHIPITASGKRNRHALPKDANLALSILNARKEKLEGMDPEKREKKEEKDKWEKVALKAEGEKVRDDEKRLKKMAKRQERTKSKSAKAWSERKETVSTNIAAKVEKRNKNLAARVQQARDKKKGIKVKSVKTKTRSKSHAGRVKNGRPGFEGGRKK
ncbi:SURF6-domain-containing protein [Meredithblackwellia eburnea MCA 4105]